MDRLAEILPDAHIFTLWNDAPHRFPADRVTESWLSRSPFRGHKVAALPLMPFTWRLLKRRDVEWLLCSSHLFAHHARVRLEHDLPKLVYAYTPARYIWTPEVDSRGNSPLVRIGSAALRPLDRRRAQEATSIAAISNFVSQRISATWKADSRVIYPPVAVASFAEHVSTLTAQEERVVAALPSEFLLGASRFVPYKRLDDVIRVGNATGLPVVIAGGGPDEARLRSMADSATCDVSFIATPSHSLLVELYRRAIAYVFPAIEDFGIMPVEAMATGTPVIGRTLGGVAETVVHQQSGVLVEDFTSTSDVRAAVESAARLNPSSVARRASVFDQSVFDNAIRDWIDEIVG